MMAAVLALAAAAACASGAWITDAEMAALEPKQVFARQAASLKLAKPNARYQNRHILARQTKHWDPLLLFRFVSLELFG